MLFRSAKAEEGRLAPERAKRAEEEPESSGKKKRSRQRSSRRALAAEPSPSSGTSKKTKTEAAVTKPTGGSPWCPIHESNIHDARDCRSLQGVIEARKRRQAERQADGTLGNCYNCNEPGHIARDCTAPRAGNRSGSRGVGRGGAQKAVAGTAAIKKNPPEVATRSATKRATKMKGTRGSRRHAPRRASTEGPRRYPPAGR